MAGVGEFGACQVMGQGCEFCLDTAGVIAWVGFGLASIVKEVTGGLFVIEGGESQDPARGSSRLRLLVLC